MASEIKGELFTYGGIRLAVISSEDGPGQYTTGITVRIDHPSNKSLHGKHVRIDMDPELARMVAQELEHGARQVEIHQSSLEKSYKNA